MQVSKRFVLCCFALVLLVVLVHRPGQAQEAEFAFRVEVVAGVPTRKVGDITPWVVDVTLPVPEFVDVEVEVVLVSRLATCVAEPATCAGSENFVTTDERGFPLVFGCSDSVDNDDNELIDLEDPNCGGVSSWSLSVAIDDDFGLNGVTTEGTVADLIISPPGIRDFQSGERTYLVDPSQNDGQQGVTAYAILSLSHHHTLAPVSESVVLKVTGRRQVSTRQGIEARPLAWRLSIHPCRDSRRRQRAAGDERWSGWKASTASSRAGVRRCSTPRSSCAPLQDRPPSCAAMPTRTAGRKSPTGSSL